MQLNLVIIFRSRRDDEMFQTRLPSFRLFDFFINFSDGDFRRRPRFLLFALYASIFLANTFAVDIDAALRLTLPPMLLR